MHKLSLLVAIIIMLMLSTVFVGCQDSGLSEDEVKAIVQAEVDKQLASVINNVSTDIDDMVAQEVAGQLSDLDDNIGGLDDLDSLVSAEVAIQLANLNGLDVIISQEIAAQLAGLDDDISEEVTSQLTGLDGIVSQEVTNQLSSLNSMINSEVFSQLSNLDKLTVSELFITDGSGNIVARMGTNGYGDGELSLYNSIGNVIASLCGLEGEGTLMLGNMYEIMTFMAGGGTSYDENGYLFIGNDNGDIILQAGANSYRDGYLILLDAYGNIDFSAP